MSAQRILVRGVNWLGDAVMSTPALLRLRQARPQAHLTLLTLEKLADLWRHHPAIDTVITFTRANCRWVIFGGQGDVELANRIAAGIESGGAGEAGGPARPTDRAVWNLAGSTGLRELCALLKACRTLLTNDTGPMHVAAAVGTPVVAPFGSTSPELTGPGLPGDPRHHLLQAAVPCAPCFLRACPIDFRCMASLSVEQVVQALLKCR
ncbi:MAG: glycosyltransferase family 9 protein [Verrucomicrobiota bacterium]